MKIVFAGLTAFAFVAGSVPVMARDSSVTNEKGEVLICKKMTEIGSLVRKRKQCMTAGDWEKAAQSQQDGARRTMDQLTERSSCAPPTDGSENLC